jgi:hypothetical protein
MIASERKNRPALSQDGCQHGYTALVELVTNHADAVFASKCALLSMGWFSLM